MTDGNGADKAAAGTASAQAQPPRMQVLAQYVRDLSFENIIAQKGGGSPDNQPDIQVAVAMDAKKRNNADNEYEISQKYKIDAKVKGTDEHLFLLELEYTGVFRVENVPEAQLHPYLLIECPRMVFPYVRRVVGDITRDGGFAPLNLDGVDFLQLYRQEAARRAQAMAAAPQA